MLSNAERKLINSIYDRLYYIGERKGWGNPVKNMLAMNTADEKQHRGNDRARFNCTITEAAKYFTVKHILDGATERHAVKDILHIRLSCYHGEAIATEWKSEIDAVISADDRAAFSLLDYVKMIE